MEHYSKEGYINRKASVAITRGTICELNEDSQLAPASADSTNALFVAEWDVAAGDTLAAKIIGASTGTALVKVAAGALVPGIVVYAAADGKASIAGTRAIGYYVGEKKTTTAESEEEVALTWS